MKKLYSKNKQQGSSENLKFCYICREKLKINMLNIKNIAKLGTNVIMQVNIELLHIEYVIWNIVYLKKLP